MSQTRFHKSLIRFTIILMVTGGFSYQTWTISNAYFRYPTATLVSLEDYLNFTTVPQVGIRDWIFTMQYGKTLSAIFDSVKKIELIRSQFESQEGEFIQDNFTYVTARPKNVTQLSPQELYYRHRPIYFAIFNVTHHHVDPSFAIFIHPYHGDFEGLQKTDAYVSCHNISMSRCFALLTYTTKIAKLQPPPYDTNCLTYQVYGYTSKENCISECLTNFTIKYGLMIESNVIKRSKYENSSLKMIPGFFRTMRDSKFEISSEYLREHKDKLVNTTLNSNVTFVDKMIDIFSCYKKHWKSCMTLCQRQDCIKESHVTIVQTVVGNGNTSSKLREFGIMLHSPNDQTTIVTSQPQINFVEFLTQIISCVSFWFGFCPLHIVDWIKRCNTKQNGQKDSHVPCDVRIRKLEQIFSRHLYYIERTLRRNILLQVEER